MEESLRDFCGNSTFFDRELFWNRSSPQFTECFQQTFVVWLPCGYLWLLLPFYARHLGSSTYLPYATSWLFRVKTMLCLLLAAISAQNLYTRHVLSVGAMTHVIIAADVAEWIKMVTFLIVADIIRREKNSGLITSGVLFVFWLLQVLTGVIPVYSKITQVVDNSWPTIAPVLMSYGIVMMQFVLSCIAETPNLTGYNCNLKNPCPELYASFLSKMVFSWILPTLNKVYKTGEITTQDFPDLNREDRCSSLDAKFNQAWQEEMRKYRQRCRDHDARNNDSAITSTIDKNNAYIKETENNMTMNKTAEKKNSNTVKGPSLFLVLAKVSGATTLLAISNKIAFDAMQLASPLLLKWLVGYMEQQTDSTVSSPHPWHSYMYAVLIFLNTCFITVCGKQNHRLGNKAGLRLNSAISTAIYRKLLTISPEARARSTVGEIVNLMSVDAGRIQGICGFLWVFVSAPFLLIASMTLLWFELGSTVLIGLSVFLITVPINIWVARSYNRLHKERNDIKDERIKLMTEILNGIKAMKLYAWEPSFEKKVMELRKREISIMERWSYYDGINVVVWCCAPYFACVGMFFIYIFMGSQGFLEGKTAYATLGLFQVLSGSINLMPHAFNAFSEGRLSLERLTKFLQASDIDENNVEVMNNPDVSLSIEDGTFSWGKDIEPFLKDINVSIPTGALVAVVGSVGSGKSSLLSTFLGEMEKTSGLVRVKGSLVHVPQQAWMQNMALKDNILFGEHLDADKYQTVIEACALKQDIDLLKSGDMTEIGEKGINLSGGQKQRVSLARAVYNNSDVYLLDDPLSAVDSHVGKHIFEKVIGPNGLLQNKTRVLVTQGVHWLPYVDTIIVLTDGRISEAGSYRQLLDHDGVFAQFLKTYQTEDHSDDSSDEEVQLLKQRFQVETDNDVAEHTQGRSRTGSKLPMVRSISVYSGPVEEKSKPADERPQIDRIIEEETIGTGTVSKDVYLTYFRAGGYLSFAIIILLVAALKLADLFSSVKLAEWTDDPFLKTSSHSNGDEIRQRNYEHLVTYFVSIVGKTILLVSVGVLLNVFLLRASNRLHNKLLTNVLQLPMSFFDTTPTGRIINRFSSSIEDVDCSLRWILECLIHNSIDIIAIVVGITYTTPSFTFAIVPVCFLFYMIQKFFYPGLRQIKRVDSACSAPIFSHFQESIQGVSTIRAFRRQKSFLEESNSRLDTKFNVEFIHTTTFLCLYMCLEVLANLTTFCAALLALSTEGMTGGLIGMAILSAFKVTETLSAILRSIAEFQTDIVSVEKIKEYTDRKTEDDWVHPDNRPPAGWPTTGHVTFHDYQTRYRDGLDLVLNGVTCQIKGGEKVGIVGRTGAGKSSLTVSLFRVIEAVQGSISIDGQDIAKMGLHDLRSNLTILPQDPVLFAGTLRMNLDPFDVFNDEQLWVALEHANLGSFVDSLPKKLLHECGEGGLNLSVGQRQLVCLARTLLKKTKVLVLDEATAAVDMATDDVIQKTIREEFKDTTILTIAHRLNTVMDYDRIMVLDKGLIKEFDSPSNLLNDPSSTFFSMAQVAGLVGSSK